MYKNIFDASEFLSEFDPEIAKAIAGEKERQNRNIELIASENMVSPEVLAPMGSVLTNKYAEGYPGARYYSGCEFIDIAENLAIDRVKELFGAEHANVQAHSGSSANLAAYYAFIKPGDTVLGMNLSEGGHLSHGSSVNISGQYYNFVAYGLDPETEMLDYDNIREIALEAKPKLIVAGASAYSREIDFKKIGEIAKEVGAFYMVDMAHIAGLVAAGLHNSPIPYADVVTSTTHKTLRGPRSGLILCKAEHAKRVDKAVFPGLQGGPLMHVIAAKAVSFKEALLPSFKEYQTQVVKNSKALAAALAARGFRIISGGTDNHLALVDLRSKNISGKELAGKLDEVYITLNKNSIPNDPASPFVTSGIRVGTPAVTTRGMKEAEMDIIANCIDICAESYDSRAEEIKKMVKDLTDKFPLYE